MLRYQTQEDTGRIHYLLMTVHSCPRLNNWNQLRSLLAVLPGLPPFPPGKGCWDNSTFTGLYDCNRQQPTLNVFQCNTEINTNLFFLERSIQVPYFRHLKQGRSHNPQKVCLWKHPRNSQFLVFLRNRLLQYWRKIAAYEKFPTFSNSSYFLWCKSLGKSTQKKTHHKIWYQTQGLQEQNSHTLWANLRAFRVCTNIKTSLTA